ncbi:MAG: phosphatidylserine decarboxylase [Candidatus Colwellbacteria bacterium]|nr:phosphatidylserine decarboxylase [Candidatus Colwellbacteria bacterium]
METKRLNEKKISIIGPLLVLAVGVLLIVDYGKRSPVENSGDSIKWSAEQVKNDLVKGKIDLEFQKYFDRDPERKVPDQKNIIVAPADGLVTGVTKDQDGVTIIIHLSLFDVHVQRVPISGKVTNIEHVGNGYFSAKDPQYLNGVQTVTTITTAVGEVKVKQITALFTTRIQTYPKVGDTMRIGDRLGQILLGSTVIVILPDNTNIMVRPGDKVYGAETVIANYR